MPITSTPDSQPTPTVQMWVKAVSLNVKQIDDRTYEVEGETGNHIVNVEDEIYSCSGCESFNYRAMCSHCAAVIFLGFDNLQRFNVAQGFVSEGMIVSTEIVDGKMIVRAEKEVKRRKKR